MIDRHICKAKRTDNGEWVEGYYTYYPEGMDETDDTKYTIRDTRTNPGKLYFIAPSTLCQYTGLPDKNVRKIWVNDIVKEESDVGIVKFGKYGNGFHYGFYIEWITTIHYRPELSFWNSRVECIGNVFDDQELISNSKVRSGHR